jgi:AI-2 transport protein TqsA
MDRTIERTCLLLLTSVVLAGALYWLRPVMVPFVLAVFISLGLSPLVDWQVRWLRVPHALALVATLTLGAVVFVSLGALVSASVEQLTAHAAAYQAQVTEFVESIATKLPAATGDTRSETEIKALSKVPVGAVAELLLGTTNAIVGVLSKSLLVFIFTVFLLIGRHEPSAAGGGTWDEIESRIRRYLVTLTAISAATGVLVGLVLALLGIHLAFLFGLFAFLLNFIPSVGSIIATLLPLPVVIVSADISPTVAVLAIAIPAAIQLIIGNVIAPKVMGASLDLHPVVILLALMFWGMLWGMVGMLLATPMTAALKILFSKLEPTRAVAEVMAGRLGALRTPAAPETPTGAD